MNVALFSVKPYTRRFFDAVSGRFCHSLTYFEHRLTESSAPLARRFDSVCAFVNDVLDAGVLAVLREGGTRVIALRSAGFNHVDLAAAGRLGLTVVRVPAYSPHAVAEHTVALILALNRKIHRAVNRVREGNFELDGLLGFDLRGRTVGVVGTGRIGIVVAKIMIGFDCHVLAFDPFPNEEFTNLGARYADLNSVLAGSDIITLHCPLTPQTRHMINAAAIDRMKPGVMLINTSRGALIDTPAVIDALKTGRIGHLGLDVYEEEADLFFDDLSSQVIQDDVFARLLTFPNVIITGHQAFFTAEALTAIAETTLQNMTDIETSGTCRNEIRADARSG